MNDTQLIEWLRENSSGIYRPSAQAADRIEELIAAIKKHRDTFPDEVCDGERELWSVISEDNANSDAAP